ncbi:MAG TPA: TIGR03089 family protein [Frankiaceae bacterium]
MTASPLGLPALAARAADQPALTVVGGDGTRVELSGATLGNGIAKNGNLLGDGLAADRVLVALPAGWPQVTLALACLAAGVTGVLPGRDSDAAAAADGADAAFVPAVPAGADGAGGLAGVLAAVPEVYGVSQHPLGLPPASLAAGLLDHAREVAVFGDRLAPAAQSGRLEADGVAAGPAELAAAGTAAGVTPADRVLVLADPAGGPAAATDCLLTRVLPALAAGAAVVLVVPAEGGGGDPALLAEQVARQEATTRRL